MDQGLAHEAGNHDVLISFPAGVTTLRPDWHKDPRIDGSVGPILPMHTTGAHNIMLWKKDARAPLLLLFHRHSNFYSEEVFNPDVVDFLIQNRDPITGVDAFDNPANQFNSSLRRSYQQFAYGGYNLIQDLSLSVPTRLPADQFRDLALLWDLNHPKAFAYDFAIPKFRSTAEVKASDGELNSAAFFDSGHVAGLQNDIYAAGSSTLEDGRAIFMGGHDLGPENGQYRVQLFDPETETWAARPESCLRRFFGATPAAAAFREANLGAAFRDDLYLEAFYRSKVQEYQTTHPGVAVTADETLQYMATVYLPLQDGTTCNPHLLPADAAHFSRTYEGIRLAGPEGTVSAPGALPSDLKYARWSPGQISLPGNQVIVFGGYDRNEAAAPSTGPVNSATRALDPFLQRKADYPALKANFELAGYLRNNTDTAFAATTVRQVVPEIYDAATDQTLALENAPLFHPAHSPNGLVVQTGPGRDDWKVVVPDAAYLGQVPSAPSPTRTSANGEALPTGAHRPLVSVVPRNFHNSYLLDVQAARKQRLKNPDATPPATILDTATDQQNNPFWTYLGESPSSHSEYCGSADVIALDRLGRVLSHRLTYAGGQYPVQTTALQLATAQGETKVTFQPPSTGEPLKTTGLYNLGRSQTLEIVRVTSFSTSTIDGNKDGIAEATLYTAQLAQPLTKAHVAGETLAISTAISRSVEEIDFASLSQKPKRGQAPELPHWQVKGELYQPARQNRCTPLPDGTILISGGNGGTLGGIENWSLHTQLYTPGMPYDPAFPETKNSVRMTAKSLLPRDEHGTAQLLPDATVYLGGQNRTSLSVPGDPAAPLGDQDIGVPCAQIFRPPYIYDAQGDQAPRPVIARAPAVLGYGRPFALKSLSLKPITAVSMVRTGASFHGLNTDTRLVQLAFKRGRDGQITVYPPKLPGTAVGGYYQLFIIDEAGVPSTGVKVALGSAITKRIGKPASPYVLTRATPRKTP